MRVPGVTHNKKGVAAPQCRGAVYRGAHHFRPTRRVESHQRGLQRDDRAYHSRNSVWDVVELEVQEDGSRRRCSANCTHTGRARRTKEFEAKLEAEPRKARELRAELSGGDLVGRVDGDEELCGHGAKL